MGIFFVTKFGMSQFKAIVAMMVAVLLTACTSPPTPVASTSVLIKGPAHAQLTPHGWWSYDVRESGARIVISNDASGGNNREIYWNPNTPDSSSAVQCTTWASGIGSAQSGMAFRIDQRADGYNAIVFARNIYMNWFWIFAPKMFHTGSEYEYDWDSPSGIDLTKYLGRPDDAVYPLRVCASLSTNNTLCFALAKSGDTLPPLDDAGIQGGCWDFDMSEFYHRGQGKTGKNGGIFAGHVPAGTSLVFDDNTLDGQPAPLSNSS